MTAQKQRTRARSDAGFTLLELTTALFVIVVGLFGVFRMFMFGMDRMRTLDEAAIAMQAVQNEWETIRATPYSMLQDGERPFAKIDAGLEQLHLADTRVSISPAPDGANGLKTVSVSVRWITENGRRSERSITTLVGDLGP